MPEWNKTQANQFNPQTIRERESERASERARERERERESQRQTGRERQREIKRETETEQETETEGDRTYADPHFDSDSARFRPQHNVRTKL